MNKQYLLLLFFVFGMAGTAFAQMQEGFGIRAGMALSKYQISASSISVSLGTEIKPYGRLFYLTSVSYNSGIQLEAGYGGRGIDFGEFDPDGTTFDGLKVTFNYLDIAALYRIEFGQAPTVGFYAVGGPVASIGLSVTGSSNGEKETVSFNEADFNGVDFGLEFGGGLLFGAKKNLAFEARYQLGFGSLVDEDTPDNDANMKHGSINLGLAYMF